jgi:hypothetical protein
VNALALWRTWYTSAGIATIPLVPYAKLPLCEAWQYVPPETQWTEVGNDFRGNIGARCGGGLAVIDGDSPEAAHTLQAFLSGLGVAAPEVATATPGHAQLYLPVVNVPPTFNWCKLPGAVGPGELRAGAGAYVVAPCSKVGDRRYRFVAGDLDTYRALRPVRWADLALLWGGWQDLRIGGYVSVAPIRLVRRAVPARASYLLELLRGAEKGIPLAGYPTRSEAEAAAVAVLVLAGFELPDIGRIFGHHLPGHYAEYRTTRQRARYLARTYGKVLGVLAASPVRQGLAELYHAAASWSWSGRGGGLDCKTYRAVVAVGWQFDTWSPNASLRVLAEHAGASVNGVKNALGRLAKSDLVRWGGQQDVTRGTTWHIVKNAYLHSSHIDRADVSYLHSSHIPSASSRQQVGSPLWAELWSRDRLGASGRLVYGHLASDGGGASAGELAAATGKGRVTIWRALKKLAGFELAESDGGHPARWRRGARDLGDVASELGCAAAGARRRARHQDERERWLEKFGQP